MTAPRDTERPCPAFAREELTWLQELLDREREARFNFYMETLNEANQLSTSEKEGWGKYKMAKEVRNKVYHLNGRDTLALERAEQRHWDQGHDY